MVPRGIVFARLSWRASYIESTRSPPLAWRVRDENGASVVEIAPDEGFEAPASIVGTYSIDVIEYNLFILSSTFALAARRRAVSATRDRIGEYGRVRHPTVDVRRQNPSSIPSPSTRIGENISLPLRLFPSPPEAILAAPPPYRPPLRPRVEVSNTTGSARKPPLRARDRAITRLGGPRAAGAGGPPRRRRRRRRESEHLQL